MGTKARGRGVAATFGLLLVLAGVAGAVVLWVMAERRPEQAVEGFARGPVGCTTTLEFTDTGTFYVYEERVGGEIDAFAACEPVPTPDAAFSVELRDGDRPVALRDDTSVAYDTAAAIGESVVRVEIDEVGRYDLVVVGPDPEIVAAVGRDPESGVDELRRGAVVVGVLGLLLGSLLLVLAGRRSKRATTYGPPAGPGWGPQDRAAGAFPEPPTLGQQPVNPMLPPEPVGTPPATPAASPTVPSDEVPGPVWPPEPPRLGPSVASASQEPEPPVSGPAVSEPAVSEPAESGSVWPPEPPRLGQLPPEPPATDDAEPTGGSASSPWAPPPADQRKDPPPPV